MTGTPLDRALATVLAADLCTGCGACTLVDPGLEMGLSPDGFLRPHRVAPGPTTAEAARRFGRACPGSQIRAARPPEATRHPLLGPVVAAWEAWAADDEVRFRGSSGGTLTALAGWLLADGRGERCVVAGADPQQPRRTVSVSITTKAEALASAGSRYAPVAALATLDARSVDDPTQIVVGKPCEIAALRALRQDEGRGPVLLSFFCAGTPSQPATDRLVEHLGLAADEPLDDLWYRGHGWPGSFTARSSSGREVSASYDESWGRHLGPTVQWRCKLCPDGVGEHADVTAADFWRSDDRGFPDFAEGAGISALIARTARGRRLVEEAIAAGVLVARPIDVEELVPRQPLQVTRRRTLAGRLAGARAAGRRVPRVRGFGLLRLALTRPRDAWRAARGTHRRLTGARRA